MLSKAAPSHHSPGLAGGQPEDLGHEQVLSALPHTGHPYRRGRGQPGPPWLLGECCRRCGQLPADPVQPQRTRAALHPPEGLAQCGMG